MSLRARLLAAFAYTLLIVIVALEVPLAANLSSRVNAEVEADSAAQTQVAAASIADQLGKPKRVQQLTSQAAQSLDGLVFVIDAHGRPIADSEGTPSSGSAPVDDPIALQALGGEVAQGRHHAGEDVLSTAVPIVRNGRTVGALEVEQSLGSVHREVRQDVAALIGIGVLALALGLGVAWILAGSISRPLNALASMARRRAGGDTDARAEPRGSAEQVAVAHAFNEMSDRLGAMLESQRAFVADASHQLRTPLTGLRLRLEAAGVKTSDPAVARELRPPSARRRGSNTWSPTCSSSPRASNPPATSGRTSRGRHARPSSAGAARRARTATRSSSTPMARRPCVPRRASSR